MKTTKTLCRILLLVLSVMTIFCSCKNTNENEWTVVLKGSEVADAQVIEVDADVCVSVTQMLMACGYSVTWETEDVARVEKNGTCYVFNKTERTLREQDDEDSPIFNLMGMAPGDKKEPAYVYDDGDLFIDYTHVGIMLSQMGETFGQRMDRNQKTVRFCTKEEVEKEMESLGRS